MTPVKIREINGKVRDNRWGTAQFFALRYLLAGSRNSSYCEMLLIQT
jgi:hypothetical protein